MRKAPVQGPVRSNLAAQRSVVRVLLIEDDASYADLVKILLSANPEQECEVTVASTLAEGLQALEQRQDLDAVLLDLSLPDSTGLDTLLAVLSAFPTINVIVLTGSDDQEQGILAVGAGAQDYLVKGEFEPNQLARVLRFSMERKQILMRLEEAQRIAKIGNWELRPDEDYFFASPQLYEILELDPAEDQLDYQHLFQVDHPLHILLQHQHDLSTDEKSENIEVILDSGSKRFLQLTSRRMPQKDGSSLYVGTLQDTTLQRKAEELQRAQELAEETARVREQVIATVSHELRTPMNAIVGMSHLLADTRMDKEQEQYVTAVQEASQLLLGIINDILLTSSLQNDALLLEEAPFDLTLTVRSIVEMLRPKAEAKGLKLLLDIQPTMPGRLLGDKRRISQVLYNVLGNAIKFTDQGEVELSVDVDASYFYLSVRDTGPGIPLEKQQDIFQAFSRLESSANKQEGTGLGLNITQALVQRMKGEIDLNSVLGEGAVFKIKLPLKVVEENSAVAAPELAYSPVQDMPADCILLVEDHKMNQIVLQRTLAKKWPDLTVRVASNGGEARVLLAQEGFDLILMDIQLPDTDGFTLTQELRSQEGGLNLHTPVLAMTAQAQVANDDRYLEAGMVDYVLKPFKPEELFQKLTQHSLKNNT